jgi:hypothetical protein
MSGMGRCCRKSRRARKLGSSEAGSSLLLFWRSSLPLGLLVPSLLTQLTQASVRAVAQVVGGPWF